MMVRSILSRLAVSVLAMLLVGADAPSGLPDVPHATCDGEGWQGRTWSADGTAAPAVPARSLAIAPVGDVPGFKVPLRPCSTAIEPAELPLAQQVPVFVMADSHGEYAIMATLLRRQGVVDSAMRWRFGKGRLVVLGDMLDRGAHQSEILWLLYKLEGEARAAGGAVHVLLGNHEAMILRGDLRYLHPRYPVVATALGLSSYAQVLGPDAVLGAWLRTRPTMLKLGDLLFLHGGVSPELVGSGLKLGEINRLNRATLDVPKGEAAKLSPAQQLVAGSDGPMWYRGYFGLDGKPAPASAKEIDASLVHFGVRRIVVGHTIVDRVQALFDGRVIAVQVYPRRDEVSGAPIMEGVARIDGRWWRVMADGTRVALTGDRNEGGNP